MGAIVTIENDNIFIEMDRRDQQQILAAATGEVIDELVYKVKGKTAISWAGINHISFFMGDINVDDWVLWERIEMFGDRVYWSATIRARNMKYGLSSLGTAEAPELADTHVVDGDGRWVKNPDGSWKMTLREDPHCRRKALSMAQRNGKRAVMPAAVLKKWLEYFLKLKQGETVDPPFQPKYVESEQGPPKKTEKKTPTKKPKDDKAVQTSLMKGRVSTSTVNYSLKAGNVTEDMVGSAFEEDGFIVVEPARELEDEEHYLIFGVLEPMGAEWSDKGLLGRWTLPKRE